MIRSAEAQGGLPSPLTVLEDERLGVRGIRLLLKREDLIHPEVPGNKWRKLRLNLADAARGDHTTLLTFGGAYSNHLRAVAAAGRMAGMATIGVVRGEELGDKPLNWSLKSAAANGMHLVFMDRATYRRKHSAQVLDRLRAEHGDVYVIPEGGSNAAGVLGAMDTPGEITESYDVICCPVGTGGTLAGVAAGARSGALAIGFSALKGGEPLAKDVARLQAEAGVPTGNWRIETRYHFGGFAKRPPELAEFAADFERRHGIVLERIYVAKMLAGLFDMAAQREVPAGTTVVAVVTGPAEDPHDGAVGRVGLEPTTHGL
ncbi:pyridoxal-phosphate dependent enzyme [Streptomonospora sp. PA3]|uniref:1-aminocyclopropane-1-carboxylate deaminase/D-cysteine desulfhydrase n=1 Tax=Streptomonospora sp. PA3 TaxID=2607326 RepID=UPI0012DD0D68|nr:pyridoxal-phosphate dependent enzyme [Streptomonospora sp. PA3]MUL41583.1 pyridoxal-phosphate dependent enzyme [Streptomonospora sp. PA3]